MWCLLVNSTRKDKEVDDKELCELARKVSLDLFNEGKAAGQVYHCYEDEDILRFFGGLTKDEVIAKVVKMEAIFAEHYDDIKNA